MVERRPHLAPRRPPLGLLVDAPRERALPSSLAPPHVFVWPLRACRGHLTPSSLEDGPVGSGHIPYSRLLLRGMSFRDPDFSLDVSSPDDPLGRALCPARAAARQVLHARALRGLLAADVDAVPGLLLEDLARFRTSRVRLWKMQRSSRPSGPRSRASASPLLTRTVWTSTAVTPRASDEPRV